MKHFSGILALLMSAIVLCGCNTVHGIGQDMQAGGKALQKAAND